MELSPDRQVAPLAEQLARGARSRRDQHDLDVREGRGRVRVGDGAAHRDELGFEPPIIKVQVKQVLDQIGRPAVQQLHGAIETGEHGLFVTLGGFSNDARVFERRKPNLRLVDGDALIALSSTPFSTLSIDMTAPSSWMVISTPTVRSSPLSPRRRMTGQPASVRVH